MATEGSTAVMYAADDLAILRDYGASQARVIDESPGAEQLVTIDDSPAIAAIVDMIDMQPYRFALRYLNLERAVRSLYEDVGKLKGAQATR